MSYWAEFCQDFQNKKVLIFGLGLQGGGVQVANTFLAAGAQVRVSDQKTESELTDSLNQLNPAIEVHTGSHPPEDIDWAEYVIKNPGVPYEHPLIQTALEQSKPVVGETALALTYLRDHSIAVTGTRGKTTTAHLIAHFLQTANIPHVLAGNIPGSPLLPQLINLDDQTWTVVEISSFQIESLRYTKTSAQIAVITSIYPDHLNRYQDWSAYLQAKTDLFSYQKPGDTAIYQADRDWSPWLEDALADEVNIYQITQEMITDLRQQYQTNLPGDHNWENIALAIQAVQSFGLTNEQIQSAMATFNGVPFRLETIAVKQGVTYINDTTATTPTALEKALDAYKNQKIILIAGGATKHLPLSPELINQLANQPTALILLRGSGQQEIQTAFNQQNLAPTQLFLAESLAEAVQKASQLAQDFKAEAVLLSPGFTSFEMFTNEFDRGEQFNELVRQLPE